MALLPNYTWYQTDEKVIVEILLKNVAEENMSLAFEPEHLELRVRLSNDPHDKEYSLKLNLCNAIVPDQCSCKIRQTKIEVHLAKLMRTRWEKLVKEENLKPKVSAPQKNWDKLVKDNLTDKDEEGGVDQLFAKIYAEGNDDQKRAMLKSFTESGGTVLSTNWDEVGSQKVEMKPPDGVEFKPWN